MNGEVAFAPDTGAVLAVKRFTLTPRLTHCRAVNLPLIFIGVLKLGIAIVVGGLGVLASSRLLSKALKLDSVLDNPAAGTVHASVLLALALLIRNSLGATYDTIDLLLRRGAPAAGVMAKLLVHSVGHIALTLVLGSTLLAMGLWLFNLLTPGVDEVEAVRQGKLGPAIVLGGIVVALALLAAPGLEALLSGLVPFPSLPVGVGVSPS
jgi:uncharacterized membrane protein YjfL (UPF0719 family)